MVTRRNFLGAVLGLMAAPVIVRAESLMKIYVPPQKAVITESVLITQLLEGSYGRAVPTQLGGHLDKTLRWGDWKEDDGIAKLLASVEEKTIKRYSEAFMKEHMRLVAKGNMVKAW